jgi:DNA-directed RNA polymerase subunit RPC12/RpoP
MTNTNCLEGIACPTCGNDAMIYIEAKTLTMVKDDGAEAFGDMEWDDDSYAECPECRHRGTLREFRTEHINDTANQNREE